MHFRGYVHLQQRRSGKPGRLKDFLFSHPSVVLPVQRQWKRRGALVRLTNSIPTLKPRCMVIGLRRTMPSCSEAGRSQIHTILTLLHPNALRR